METIFQIWGVEREGGGALHVGLVREWILEARIQCTKVDGGWPSFCCKIKLAFPDIL